MKKVIITFGVKLGLSLLAVFVLHYFILQILQYQNYTSLLIETYLINFLLAFVIVVLMLSYINKLKNYIGFIFMFGSFLKFGVFFIFFYPIFKSDGIMTSYEFLLFFIPYVIALIFETLSLTKILNKL